MLFFDFLKIIYLASNFQYLNNTDFISLIAVFWHSIKLDISTICYISIFTFLILLIQSLYSPKWLNYLHAIYVGILILVFVIITFAEIGLYSDWHTKLHYKALKYLSNPSEIINTAGTSKFYIFILASIIISGGFFFLWFRYFRTNLVKLKRNFIFTFLLFITMPGTLVVGMRGGLQEIPINQSDAYYSKLDILNLAAINSGWNLLYSIVQNYKITRDNPFKFYSDIKAKNTIINIQHSPNDTITSILKTHQPNIVLFILEGFSADVMASGGGDSTIAPFLNQLSSNGITFTNIYSSGTRSQQGMSAIFSGFPATPLTTITQEINKYTKLPSVVKKISEAGYSTSFYFGGDLNYGNLKSYMFYNNFDKIIEEKDFNSSLPRGKLGIHDEFTFTEFQKNLDTEKQPFFSSIFTISTHTPYDMEMEENFNYEFEKEYVNAVAYTDKCFSKFFKAVQNNDWYHNTLFIFISDHSHGSYKNHNYYSPERYKMVFFLYGEVIKDEYRKLQISKTGSQIDFTATILPQLEISAEDFIWSKNLLNPYSPEYAYYSFEVGLGWVRPYGYFVYECNYDATKFLEADSQGKKDTLVTEGKSYLQYLFNNYMEM